MMMSNRSIFNCYYTTEHEDGSYSVIASSKGTEPFVATEDGKKLLGKNVLATNHLNYRLLVPYEEGCTWTSIVSTDIAGSIPAIIKNKGASRVAPQAEGIIKFILTEEVPT